MVRNWYRSSPIRNNMFSFNFLNFFQRFFFLWSKFRQKSGYQIIYRTEYSVPKISKDLSVEFFQRLYNVQDWLAFVTSEDISRVSLRVSWSNFLFLFSSRGCHPIKQPGINCGYANCLLHIKTKKTTS